MPMMTTRLLSSRATSPQASMRGVTKRCTGLMPSTSIASISSRIVREPRSAHIAVEPAPATIKTVTSGPTWVTAPNAAPAPDRSAAPNSRNRMLRVKLTRTVNGIATNSVGTIATRATNHDCSKNSRHWKGRRKANLIASNDIANKPPTACMGLEPRPNEIPEDQRSAPVLLLAIGSRPFRTCEARRPESRPARTNHAVRQIGPDTSDRVDGLAPHARPSVLLRELALPRNAGRPRPDSLRRSDIVTHATSRWSKNCTTVIDRTTRGRRTRTVRVSLDRDVRLTH